MLQFHPTLCIRDAIYASYNTITSWKLENENYDKRSITSPLQREQKKINPETFSGLSFGMERLSFH